jgi:class 3 adenylate cyclase
MPRGLPGGTVTFLFTDVEDSSRLWEDASADLAVLHEILSTLKPVQ